MKLFLLLQLRITGHAGYNSTGDMIRVLIEALTLKYDPARALMYPYLHLSFGCKTHMNITASIVKNKQKITLFKITILRNCMEHIL